MQIQRGYIFPNWRKKLADLLTRGPKNGIPGVTVFNFFNMRAYNFFRSQSCVSGFFCVPRKATIFDQPAFSVMSILFFS